jgi:hypothetical protein
MFQSAESGNFLVLLKEVVQDSERFVWITWYLPLDRDVFISDLFLGDLDVLYYLFRNILRYILSEVLYGVVVRYCNFLGNSFYLSFFLVLYLLDLFWNALHLRLIFILNNFLFKRHVFNPAFSLDDLLACVYCSSNDLPSSGYSSGAWNNWYSNCISVVPSNWVVVGSTRNKVWSWNYSCCVTGTSPVIDILSWVNGLSSAVLLIGCSRDISRSCVGRSSAWVVVGTTNKLSFSIHKLASWHLNSN